MNSRLASIILLIALLVACSKRTQPTAHDALRALGDAAPTSPAAAANTTADASDRSLGPEGCERPFPSTGTRYVERYEQTLVHPKDDSSFMLGGDRTTRLWRTVTLDDVAGAVVERAHYFDKVDGLTFVDARHELDTVDGGTPRFIGERQPVPTSLFALVGSSSFSKAMATSRLSGRVTSLEPPLERMLVDACGEGVKITVQPATKKGNRYEYRVEATGKRESFATCHGLYEAISLVGTLTVRATDGAFIELALHGPDELVEDVCSPDGRTRIRSAPKTGMLDVKIRRDCFDSPPDGG